MSNKEKRERVRQCFTLDPDLVKKIQSISRETGVPKSRVVENCFGNGGALADFEKFCSVKKRKKEGE